MAAPVETTAPKRIGRRILVACVALVALLVIAVLGAYAWLNSDSGRGWLAAEIAGALTTPGEQEATIGELEGSLPGSASLTELSLADKDGVWLRVEAASLDWSPLALLAGRLEIARLAAKRIEIARLPQSEAPEETDEDFALPALPLDLTLQELTLDEVALGAEVLGSPAAFRVEGEAAARADDALRSSLRVMRTDGGAGEVTASAAYRPAHDHLALELTVAEPAGGLIARALELAELPAIDVKLVGEGPVSDWAGKLTLKLDGLAEADADLALSRDPDALLTMTGSAVVQGPPDLRPLLTGQQRFALEAAWRDERLVEIRRASLANDLGRLEIAGTLDTESLATNATAQLDVPDAASLADLMAPLTLGSATASVTASGPLLQPDVDLDLTLRDVSAPSVNAADATLKLTAKPDGPLDDEATTTALIGKGTVTDLAVDPADVTAPLLGDSATWALEAALATAALDLSRVELNAGGVALQTSGQVDLTSGEIVLSSQIGLDDLSRLEAASGLPAQGALTLRADFDATDFGASLRATLDGSLNDFALGIPAADTLLGPSPTFGADITLAGNGGLAVSAARLEGAALWATGDAAFPPDFASVTANLTAGLDDLQRLSEIAALRLAGSAGVEAQLAGPLSAPTSSGLITSEGTQVEDFDLGRITVAYDAANLIDAPKGNLELSLTAPALRLTGGTAFALGEAALDLNDTKLTGEGTQLEGKLRLPLDGGAMAGDFTLEAARLAPWLGLAGLPGDGALGARLRLSGEGARQAVDLGAHLRDLTYPLGEGEKLTVDSGELSARIADLTKPTEVDVSAKFASLAAGPADLAETSLTAKGSAGGADFVLSTRGDLLGALALNVAGRFQLADDAMTLLLAELDGQVIDRPLSLRQTTSLHIKGEDIALDRLDLDFAGGTLSADGRLTQETLQANLTLDELPLDLAKLAAPDSALDGNLSGALRIEGSRSDPSGTASFQIPDLRLGDLPDLPQIAAEMDADWRRGRLALTAGLSGFAETPANLEAELPLRLDPESLALATPEGEAISGRLDWSGDLAQIWPLVPIDGHRLSGAVELAAALDGTLATPNLSGALTLTGGAYENFETGTLLEDLALTLDLAGDQAVLESLSATDGEDGQLSVKGELAVLPEQSFPFSINTQFQDFTLLRRDDITAVKSGELTLEGSLDSAAVGGQLVAKRIEIQLSRDLPPEVVDLEVVEVNGGEEQVQEEDVAESPGPEIALDLLVDLPGQIFVRGLGLESEWGGKLIVKGTAAAPVIDGDIAVLRGQMSIIGKTFMIESGSVSFTGESEIDPILDIEAKNESGELTVIAKVTGPASQPTFALSSIPSLPQDEIVAQMLFGKNTSQLSSIEAIQLAQAVAELSGKGGSGGGVLDFTRNLLGLDVLRVESDAAGGPAVGAGKYVTDDVYVGVKQGTTAGSGTVGVEVELTPHISLKSDVGQTGESDIGVNFKWDY